ncbi:MAG: hypothetical protein IJI96_05320 [Methanobrevibacter sp.]|nr:hypothetical protein [Methanobrevibacter sp.]MBQ6627744.1 hypothetical protein [Methanobrevibacter sp.]
MDKDVEEFIEDLLEIKKIGRYDFREIYGFTFVFKKEIFLINDHRSSAEIKPIGIIYEENGEYYLAPIGVVDEIEEVIKEFVKQQLKSKN